MPTTEYESLTNSVLAWKKSQKLGRFDPNAGTIEEQKIRASEREVEERGKFNFGVFAYHSSQPIVKSKTSRSKDKTHRIRQDLLVVALLQRRCFKMLPNWTATYLQPHNCITVASPQPSRIQYVSSCNLRRRR